MNDPTPAEMSFEMTDAERAIIEEISAAGESPQESQLHAAERAVLAAMVRNNGDGALPIAMRQLLLNSPDAFSHANHKEIAAAIRALKDGNRPVYVDAVISRCGFDEAPQYLTDLMAAPALALDQANREAEVVWQSYRERRTVGLINEASEAVKASPSLARSVSANVRNLLARLEDDAVMDGLPDILDGAQLLTTSPILPEVIIDGMLHKGSKLSLGGASKAYKSWTLMNIALSLSCGAPWMGFPCARCRVLYVNLEIQPGFAHKRLETLCLARMLFPETGWLDIWNLRGYSAPHSIIIPKIIKRARELGYGLVIIDPIYKLFGAGTDESAGVDVSLLMNSMETITTQTGAAVAFGAHFAKGNASQKEAIDRVSGSGVYARDPDSILTFTKHQEEECFTVEVIHRNFPPQLPFVVKWNYPQFSREDDLDPAKLKQAGGRPPEYTKEDLLDFLKVAPMTIKEWRAAADAKLGMKKTTFYDLKKALVEKNMVFENPITSRWQSYMGELIPKPDNE